MSADVEPRGYEEGVLDGYDHWVDTICDEIYAAIDDYLLLHPEIDNATADVIRDVFEQASRAVVKTP